MMRRAAGITPWRRVLGAVLCGLLLGALWASSAGAGQWPPTSEEVKLGDRIAKEIEAHYRLVTDKAQVARLTHVGAALARVVERQDLTYHFQIIDSNVVNAFSIPGGWVYVTEGMMKFVRTDHELAAVLAHELVHVNRRHYYIQEERARHMSPALILAAALSVLARSPGPMIGVQLATQGAMSDYQRDLEKEADLGGIAYLMKTPYSPVAMLTLMEHLARVERLSGQPDDLGIYQDHPRAAERVAYIKADLERLGVPIVRRIPEGYLAITLDPPDAAPGQAVTIRVDGEPVLTIGASAYGVPAPQRAQAVAENLDAFFNKDPAPFDVRALNVLGRWSIVGDERDLFDVTPQDAAFARTTPDGLAQDIRFRLARVIAAAPYNRKY
jgi:Zn-dependent protease with chaperone function